MNADKISILKAVVSSCATNCYIVNRPDNNECICVDPGDMGDKLFETISSEGLKLAGILLTHGHFDHIGGADKLRTLSGAMIFAWENERIVMEDPDYNLTGAEGREYSLMVDNYLADGEEFTLAGIKIKLIGTPGHTPGGCCYYLPEDDILFCGDTIFQGSIGRTDFRGGNHGTLISSVRNNIFTLPDSTLLLPGHGPASDVAEEKSSNPFFR